MAKLLSLNSEELKQFFKLPKEEQERQVLEYGLQYTNEFLTVGRMAEFYDISENFLQAVLNWCLKIRVRTGKY